MKNINCIAFGYLLIFASALLFGCSGENNGDVTQNPSPKKPDNQKFSPLFRQIPASQSGIDFTNRISENAKINFIDYFYLYNGGGVAIGDVNNDSLPDIFFTGNQVTSKLYLNKGKSGNVPMQFEDITEISGVTTAGWCTGVTMVDINQDGLLDIYVCRAGNDEPGKRTNLLYINQGMNEAGVPVFTESAHAFGLDYTGYSTQAAFFDYDKDGDLDMYLLTHTNEIKTPNNIVPIKKDGSGPANDRLYRNDLWITGTQIQGEQRKVTGEFTDVTLQAGILYDGLGLGVGISDLNNDGWEDIYVSNDFLANDRLYINNRNGTFSDQAETYLKHQSNFAMGNDLADFNNDGWVDIMVVDMLPTDNEQRKKMAGPMKYEQFEMGLKMGYQPQYMRNTLQRNNGINAQGTLTFSEIGQLSGVNSTDWSWAPLWADFDNDGYKDLLITNGYRRDITDLDFVMYNASFSNQPNQQQADQIIREKARQMPGLKKSNFMFRNKGDLTFEDVTTLWGLNIPTYSNGAAYGDFDNDGDLDLVINNIDDPASLFENTAETTSHNHYLSLQLKGNQQNLAGLGAKILVYTGNQMQLYHHSVTKGYQSSVDFTMHIGLGKADHADSLVITWPDGKTQLLNQVAANQTLTLVYADAVVPKPPPIQKPRYWFKETTEKLHLPFVHQEDAYNDFAREFLLPHKHSQMGPGIAVGDVNGDGLEDFYVGGAYKQPGSFFLQNTSGTFRLKSITNEKKYEEDLGVLLFDVDGDGDLDLYVAAGSNEFGENSEYYQDQLYLNDGKGNFQWSPQALPVMHSSSSCVVAADFDQDGDLDLFVGGRLKPLQYPFPGTSYLLQNNQGIFKNVTDEIAPGLSEAGMVTTALWTDFNEDRQIDLIIAGEFMPIQFYQNLGGKLKNITATTGLTATTGWWNSLNGADFDNDGDIDYVLGNVGLNGRFKATPEQPVSVYAADFDNNGSIDPLFTYYVNGQEYPVHSRDDLISQMVSMRHKFRRYADYAQAHIEDIVPPDLLEKSYKVRANRFENTFLENLGKGKFKEHTLPLEAQTAPVYGTLCQDFDQDGNVDILLIGNSYSPDVVTGRYDASIGLVLKGDGKGNFQPIPHTQSGFFVDGDGKGLASLTTGNNKSLIIATQNNGPLKVFEKNNAHPISFVEAETNDAWVEFRYADGSVKKQELYYGASYLSQFSRKIEIPVKAITVVMYDYSGNHRTVSDSKVSKK